LASMENLAPSLLHMAYNGDLLEMTKILAMNPTIIDCRDQSNLTPLMLAAAGRHLAQVRFLLEHGADLRLTDNCGEDALMKACATRRNGEVIEALLDRGASVNHVSESGRTPLIEAACLGDDENVFALLKWYPDVNHVTENDETALTFAVVNGTTAVVRRLLAAGANVNWADKGGSTPLIFAISEEEADKVRALLDANADPTHRELYALRQAVRTGNVEIMGMVASRCDASAVRRMAEEVNAAGWGQIKNLLSRISGDQGPDAATDGT